MPMLPRPTTRTRCLAISPLLCCRSSAPVGAKHSASPLSRQPRAGSGLLTIGPIDNPGAGHPNRRLARPAGFPALASHYSAFALARHALDPHLPWPRAWRSPAPKSSYDAIVIGGAGHGLAAAYYLAANHGMTNVAVLEKSYIGSGNIGRNTTIVRSNYMIDGNTQFFEF